MPEEEVSEEEKPEKKKKKTKYLKIIAGIVAFFVLLILIIAKISNPELPTFWIVVIGGVVFIITFVGLFGNFIISKLKGGEKEVEEGKVPDPISKEEAYKIVYALVTYTDTFETHIKKVLAIKPYSFGKNQILDFQCLLAHRDREGKILHVFVNLNYPKTFPTHGWDLTNATAKFYANNMSHDPEESPDVEKEVIESPLTGVRIEKEKRTRPRIKKTKEEET